MAVADTAGKRNLTASDEAVEPDAAAEPPTTSGPQRQMAATFPGRARAAPASAGQLEQPVAV